MTYNEPLDNSVARRWRDGVRAGQVGCFSLQHLHFRGHIHSHGPATYCRETGQGRDRKYYRQARGQQGATGRVGCSCTFKKEWSSSARCHLGFARATWEDWHKNGTFKFEPRKKYKNDITYRYVFNVHLLVGKYKVRCVTDADKTDRKSLNSKPALISWFVKKVENYIW